jgi:hypothetical protein
VAVKSDVRTGHDIAYVTWTSAAVPQLRRGTVTGQGMTAVRRPRRG